MKQQEFQKMKFDAAVARFEAGELQDQAQFFYEYSYTLDSKDLQDQGEIQRRFQLLCTELKFLYVAITRPKKRLFIYDHDVEARKPIEAIWNKLGAVTHVTQEQIVQTQQERYAARAAAATAASGSPESVGKLGDAKCDAEMWKFQGLRFLKQRNYSQAIKCFQFAGERGLALRCRAYIIASEAQES